MPATAILPIRDISYQHACQKKNQTHNQNTQTQSPKLSNYKKCTRSPASSIIIPGHKLGKLDTSLTELIWWKDWRPEGQMENSFGRYSNIWETKQQIQLHSDETRRMCVVDLPELLHQKRAHSFN